MPEAKTTAELIAEGRALLAASYATADLLPLEADRISSLPISWPEGLGWFVCDRNGLGWASSRNDDRPTAELIAWAINHLPRLLEMAVREAEAAKLLEYALHLRMYGERAPGGDETWREFDTRNEAFLRGRIDEVPDA